MARKVFYSFHYERDAWRAGQVRNSNLLADEDEYGVIDGVEWEKIERQGREAIERWINEQLQYTSVTVVLIGAETADREWVRYEIRESWNRGNGLLGVRIHSVKDQNQRTDMSGPNPFDQMRFTDGTPLSSICQTYDWVNDNGRENLGKWAEESSQARAMAGTDKKIDDGDDGDRESPVRPSNQPSGPTIIRNPPGQWAR